jgi:hypothetical protein
MRKNCKKKLYRKTQRRRRMKAGNPKHKCCMCKKSISNDGLMPRTCYMKHGENAHRICEDCWWKPDDGFATESETHGCPGCLKGIQLTNHSKTKKRPLIIHEKGREITVISSDSV